jgi:Spy/CpxP family protein refolding chaperone
VVNGNLKLEDLEGDATAYANGSIHLELDPRAGQKMEFKADGNLICRFAEDASISIHILNASEIKTVLPEVGQLSGPPPYQFNLGDGDAELTLSAGGHILLGEQTPEWKFDPIETDFIDLGADITDQITAQLEAQMQMMENQIEAQLENLTFSLGGAGISQEAAERMSRKAREASARATSRAQEKMKRAQEKIQKRLEAAQRKVEAKQRAADRRSSRQGRQNWGFDWPSSPSHPQAPATDPVSEDERLMILKMLEENKISPEEADLLLEALDGK